MKKQADFFSDELRVIKPKVIITMGDQCDNLLKQYFKKIDKFYKIIQIKHPGRVRFEGYKVFDEISNQFDDVKKIYEGLGKGRDVEEE